ncbi:MAG: hypothetical protein AB8H86_19745 [Polyangiales bacterium]
MELNPKYLAALGLATGLALVVSAWVRQDRELSESVDLHGADFVTSQRCAHCHEEHYASWAGTYHRTMTQEASDVAVLAPFNGEQVRYRGWAAVMSREGEAFVMRVSSPSGEDSVVEVVRSVGSHRYQQYLTREGDEYTRLPWAWHVEEARWFHMNGAFLTPDPPDVAAETDYQRHVVRWNDNCIFCHNVAPNPNLGPLGFDSHVAELGVACEACHGPGDEHSARNTSPLRRYTLHATDDPDPSIVSPSRLSADRAADVCGRCHGQRLTSNIADYLEDGDPFVPGDDLAHHSEPLWADTTLNGDAIFRERFWDDGSPRLTAYEYQGWLQARCTIGGALTCTTCHGMHEGEAAGQLRPGDSESFTSRDPGGELGDRSCAECHSELSEAQSAAEHGGTGHAQVACVDCHMPRIVYGVLDAHRTHRIEIPRPEAAAQRPHACGLCHLGEEDSFFGDDGGGHTAVGLRWLFGGDPIVRALAADAYGRSELNEDEGALLAAMERDAYPAIRRLAWRSLRRRNAALAADDFDPMATREEREAAIASLGLTAVRPDQGLLRELEADAADVNIEIGE